MHIGYCTAFRPMCFCQKSNKNSGLKSLLFSPLFSLTQTAIISLNASYIAISITSKSYASRLNIITLCSFFPTI